VELITGALVAAEPDAEIPVAVEPDAAAPVAVAFDPEVLGAFGDPGMSGAILEGAVDAVDDVDDEDDVDDVDWANAAVTPAIRNSTNDFFIR